MTKFSFIMNLSTRRLLPLLLLPVWFAPAVNGRGTQSYREITLPTVAEAAAAFARPHPEYGAIHWAIWGGLQTRERILNEIQQVYTNGGGVYMINNSRGVQPTYLSPQYMDLVKFVVQQCKQRGMKVWIEGDCGYPDGFAGGLISKDHPRLGMQGIVPDAHVTVAEGQTVEFPLPPDTLGIVAKARTRANAGTRSSEAPAAADNPFPLPADGVFKYNVPRGGAGELTIHLSTVDIRYQLTVGEPFILPLPPDTKGIGLVTSPSLGRGRMLGAGDSFAVAREGETRTSIVVPIPTDGYLKWTAPAGAGAWELTFIRHAFRSSPTRNDNGEDAGVTKDTLYSLIDYLDPRATDTYLKLIYQAYEQAVGDEFGKTVLGFRGDETDFTGVNPWTPKLLNTFQAVKGYDLKPYIPLIFGGDRLTPGAQRVKADYWDVWSAMFRDNFYRRMEQWCTARHMEFMVHLNHEEKMLGRGEGMISNEGSFWRDMRYVGVPGIDNLNQIGPGIEADFPKLAASAAHVYGHPQVWAEEGGGTGPNGKFVADYQLVRGVNYMNIRGLNRTNGAAIGWYVSRAQQLLASGRPAAQVAYLHPTDSMWLGDQEADDVLARPSHNLVTQLLEHQIDFDHIDSDALASVLTRHGAGLRNLSGQTYRAVIIPPCSVIQKAVLDRLRSFANAGGRVLFVGRTPTIVVDRTFLQAGGPPDLSFATLLEPKPNITDQVLAALPPPEVNLDSPCPSVKYLHRILRNGDIYFFFNESSQTQTRTATLAGAGSGQVQVWDAATGAIHPLEGITRAVDSDHVTLPLSLAACEAKFIVLQR
jgi:hypothetical protein